MPSIDLGGGEKVGGYMNSSWHAPGLIGLCVPRTVFCKRGNIFPLSGLPDLTELKSWVNAFSWRSKQCEVVNIVYNVESIQIA